MQGGRATRGWALGGAKGSRETRDSALGKWKAAFRDQRGQGLKVEAAEGIQHLSEGKEGVEGKSGESVKHGAGKDQKVVQRYRAPLKGERNDRKK